MAKYAIIVRNGAGYHMLTYEVTAKNENEAMIQFYKDKVFTYEYIVANEDVITLVDLGLYEL